MSHFVMPTQECPEIKIFKTVPRQVVVPVLPDAPHTSKQQKMMKLMFFHLKNEEYEKIHKANAIQMERQFHQLRKKMKLKANQKHVQNSFDCGSVQHKKIELSELIAMTPQKIDLLKHYKAKVCRQLTLFKEAEQIEHQKENFELWYNNCKNNPISSPIFSKMNYLLEKVAKQTLPRKQTSKNEQDKRKYCRIQRKSNLKGIEPVMI